MQSEGYWQIERVIRCLILYNHTVSSHSEGAKRGLVNQQVLSLAKLCIS